MDNLLKKTCHKCLIGIEKEDDNNYIKLYYSIKEIESHIDSLQINIDFLIDLKNELKNLINIIENNRNIT